MDAVRRILVVNRLTQYTREALRYGMFLSRQFGAELIVLRVYSNPVDQEALNAPSLLWKSDEYRNYLSVREQYREELEHAIRDLVQEGFPMRALVTDKEPIPEVLRIVREEEIDLLVMLAHEEGRLEHLLFGGENDALIRKLPCSIFLVKHEPQGVKW
ncbi:universal stress protein [Geomesophilobacter sediminis]|uniref:Universal stress protein n=1 Tax=Geomesophilobacter sediminis TaxID=2798584 RepID=A0A8J7M1X2_9BACT|nr:universal stress protein [Geomesophilobacter sediminis]MBJ6727175.1 universal stress protein [Geomesophilobacter sediminis]